MIRSSLSITICLSLIGAANCFKSITLPYARFEIHRDSSSQLKVTQSSQLPSSYDTNLPATLRGEAVRSALRSNRGVCLDFTSVINPQLNVAVVQVTGEGTINFLNSKLTNTFSCINPPVAPKVFQFKGYEIQEHRGSVREGCFLTSRGRIIDRLVVATFCTNENSSKNIQANLITSPGHGGSALFKRLDPFVFPLDRIKLNDLSPDVTPESKNMRVITIASTKLETVQNVIKRNVYPLLRDFGLDSTFSFPKKGKNECIKYSILSLNENSHVIDLIIIENTFLPKCVCSGYTLIIVENTADVKIADNIWNTMISENNFDGPIELGPREYETLRIEGGQPGYLFEMTGAVENVKDDSSVNSKVVKTNSSPLELYLDDIVDVNKGCYQGQEGIASILKNKRGAPRMLYSVTFPEEDNFYDDGSPDEEEFSNHADRIKNKTKYPVVGDELYVLGSNEMIKVGTLTSVAEKGGTSSSETIALALVRRSDSILKQMDEMGLEIDLNDIFEEDPLWLNENDNNYSNSNSINSEKGGIIFPPPIDPLDGLEVVIKGSFTRGKLKVIPPRRLIHGQNLFETGEWSKSYDAGQKETGSVMGVIPNYEMSPNLQDSTTFEQDNQIETFTQDDDIKFNIIEDDEEVKKSEKDLQIMIEEAAKAASEAKKKAEKLEMLQKRAEAALEARRKKAADIISGDNTKSTSVTNDKEPQKDVEAKRKAEKMETLRLRAEAAIAARKVKKLDDDKNV